MEEEREPLYYNPVYSQMPPSTPNASKTISDAIPVPGKKLEPTIAFDYKLNEPSIPNLQQNVQYQSMPP